MSLDEAPLSTHAASQAWFSMMLANDPNTALAGSLRPPRHHSLWAALCRPFERRATLALATNQAEIEALRPRSGRWIGRGLLFALSVGLAALGLDGAWTGLSQPPAPSTAARSEALGTAALPVRAPPPLAVNVAGDGVSPLLEAPAAPAASKAPGAAAPSAQPLAAEPPRAAAKAVPSQLRAKKRPRARLPRKLDRAFTERRAPR